MRTVEIACVKRKMPQIRACVVRYLVPAQLLANVIIS